MLTDAELLDVAILQLEQFDLAEAESHLRRLRRRQTAGMAAEIQVALSASAAGQMVMELNAESFPQLAQDKHLPDSLHHELRACAWPVSLSSPYALADLRPLFGLLLEAVQIRYERGEVPDVLVALHLIQDHLPLLGWQQVLGSGGMPRDVEDRFAAAEDTAEFSECPTLRRVEGIRSSCRNAMNHTNAEPRYLDRVRSMVAEQLRYCGSGAGGGCASPCPVVPQGFDAYSVGVRMRVARALTNSKVMDLRHQSPSGHLFDVPTRAELREAWAQTWSRLVKSGCPDVNDEYVLPGLPTMLGWMTGQETPLPVSRLTTALRDLALTQTLRATIPN